MGNDLIQPLLDKVDLTRLKYEKLDQLNASRFNLFSIFNLDEDEINHSKFLGALLDPLGSHGQGNLFLSLFVNELLNLNENLYLNIDLANCLNSAKVYIEHSFNEKNFTGRLDIYIKLNNLAIAIENKINASDQPEQLIRYDNYLKTYNKNAILVYLTVKDKDPESALNSEIAYSKILYKDFINSWIKTCISAVPLVPILRESLLQYQLLIKKISGLNPNQMENQEIKSLLTKNEQYFLSALKINAALTEVQLENNLRFWNDFVLDLRKNKSSELYLDENWTIEPNEINASTSSIKFIYGNNAAVWIGIENILKRPYLGIYIKKDSPINRAFLNDIRFEKHKKHAVWVMWDYIARISFDSNERAEQLCNMEKSESLRKELLSNIKVLFTKDNIMRIQNTIDDAKVDYN